MPKVTREKQIADALAKGLDTLDLEPAWIVLSFSRYSSAIHSNLFEVILTFLNSWANMYISGEVESGDKMYRICEMSYRMVRSLSANTE